MKEVTYYREESSKMEGSGSSSEWLAGEARKETGVKDATSENLTFGHGFTENGENKPGIPGWEGRRQGRSHQLQTGSLNI